MVLVDTKDVDKKSRDDVTSSIVMIVYTKHLFLEN